MRSHPAPDTTADIVNYMKKLMLNYIKRDI